MSPGSEAAALRVAPARVSFLTPAPELLVVRLQRVEDIIDGRDAGAKAASGTRPLKEGRGFSSREARSLSRGGLRDYTPRPPSTAPW